MPFGVPAPDLRSDWRDVGSTRLPHDPPTTSQRGDVCDYTDAKKTVITWLVLPPIVGIILLVGLGIGLAFGDSGLGASIGLAVGFFWVTCVIGMGFAD